LRIVLDTNVLVSGLLSPYGPPAAIVRMVTSGSLTVCVDARILIEYEEVLARPKFGFAPEAIEALMDYLETASESIASEPLPERLPDADDEPFLEVLLAGGAVCLVTGNAAHFPLEARARALVLSPADFLQYFRDHA
jgi:uncharacterized protein